MSAFEPGRTVVIRNPISGRRRSRKLAARLADELDSRGFRVLETQAAGDASRLAQSAVAEGADSVVCLGGDGTVFETIAELPPEIALAQFPTGTVNLLARNLGISNRREDFLELLENRETQSVYFARCNDRPFTSVASVGFDAETVRHVNKKLKKVIQEGAYALKALQLFFGYRVPNYRVEIDGQVVDDEVLGVLMGTGPRFGGPHKVFAGADLSRPKLSVALLTGKTKGKILSYTLGLATGGLAKNAGVIHLEAEEVKVHCDPSTAIELDGDDFVSTPATFSIETTPRQILAPPRSE